MYLGWVGIGLGLVLAAPAGPIDSAADVVSLRDGSVVLGQVQEPSPRGGLSMLVRRSWAKAALPSRIGRWEATEATTARRALTQRKARLKVWRRERLATIDDPKDAILAWIDRELSRIDGPEGPSPSPLMVVALSRGEVRSVVRRPRSVARMLRQGWLSGFENVETLKPERLRDALEGRGFAATSEDLPAIDRLLPIPDETPAAWQLRRAATEVGRDPGLRFLKVGGAVLPEPEPGQALDGAALTGALSGLKSLLGQGPAVDPVAERLQKVAERGGVGAVVTELGLGGEGAGARVESTLWVRAEGGRWMVGGSRAAAVRADEVAPEAGRAIGDDPQVKAVFGLVESLGLGTIPDEIRQKSLNAGAATQAALGRVRTALARDLERFALPVAEANEPERKPARPPVPGP